MYDLLFSFGTAFVMSFIAIPTIIRVSRKKHLFDKQNDRTSHSGSIPTLGGLAIFSGLVFSLILLTPVEYFSKLQFILGAIVVLFLVGAKDDIDPVSPLTKLMSQFFAAGLLVFGAGIRITTLYSIFGVGELPAWLSIFISFMVIIALINAFNLIDGIDGLAATISILNSLVFGFWFMQVGRIELAMLAFALVGSVLAFLRFNLTPAKIFMGDTGSLIVGLVAAILSIEFIEHNKLITASALYVKAAPAMAIAVLIIPVFDTARIFTLRIARGRSPFRPDKNHVHHQLVKIGFNHLQTTLILLTVNILFIFIAYSLSGIGNVWLVAILVFIATVLSIAVDYIERRRRQNKSV
jgi:UDP-N-acetylmuramyl pentapeptide phosphotransferase/UDP-N-acetylglucosamine-1-phosphate transferase